MDSEKREFPRLNSGTVRKFLKLGPGTSMDEQRKIISTQDLSCTGARVVARGDISPGEYLTLILKLPFTFFPILINGEIRWVKDLNSNNGISNIKEAGIKFLEMHATGQFKIERFLAKKIKTEKQPLYEGPVSV
ncbi:MAG: PilZ domain-containing protein [Candidatus Omnitrophota bacterium]